jgi:hypothetical protein
LLLIAAICTGCFDRRANVAWKTLQDDDGVFHEAALDAAIEAKFPEGTQLTRFAEYVQSSRGECSEVDAEGKVWCEIPVQGMPCFAALLGFDLVVQGGSISSIETVVGSLGC